MGAIERRIKEYAERASAVQAAGLYFYLQPVDALDGAYVTIRGRRMLLASSYSYLGLLGHPAIRDAAQAALARYGTGTHGVRLLAGNTDLHDRLEARLAEFTGTEAVAVYSSGYLANVAAISALLSRDDVVICDKLDHASIVDGCLLSGARFVRVPHNDLPAFERALREAPSGCSVLVVVDAVFSMDGDLIDLPRLVELCRRRGAWLMVDESHSLGVLGYRGEGIEAHFGLTGAVHVKMSSLSKSIPSAGGYIAGSRDLITYLKHASRAFVFSAALPPASAAAIIAALDVMEAEPQRVERLRTLSARLRTVLRDGGVPVRQDPTPIVPVITGDDEAAMHIARYLDDRDIFALPIVSPAVPPRTSRLRITTTAAHTEEEVDRIAGGLVAAWRHVMPAALKG
ncbi:MAG: 8-amino-7-oxononanoate synthase [Armatimonadota bacterium]|nr:8-amino-7-oxononanoate synthase [Armatimonadota bacterium]